MYNKRARGITTEGRPIFSEDIEHIRVADWLLAHNVFFCHCPNGGSRNVIEAAKLKRMGVLPGVSDFLIFDPPPWVLQAPGAVLELKALDGKPPTGAQVRFLDAMSKRGYATGWHRGAEMAIQWLQKYCGYGVKR